MYLPVKVDFNKLRIVANQQTHASNTEDTSVVLTEFINFTSNLLYTIKSINEKELALLTLSLNDWLKNNTGSPRINPNIREICIANLGNVFNPEAAYEHPVIILEKIPGEELVLVVPTKTSSYSIAYDPVTNPTGNKYIIKADQSNGLNGTCGIELKQIRVISTCRLISVKGTIDQQKYKEIKERLNELFFPNHSTKASYVDDRLLYAINGYTTGDEAKIRIIKNLISDSVNEFITLKTTRTQLIDDELINVISEYVLDDNIKVEEIKEFIKKTVKDFISEKKVHNK